MRVLWDITSDDVTGQPNIDHNNSGSNPTASGKRPVSKAKKLHELMKDCAQETFKQCNLLFNLLCYFCN